MLTGFNDVATLCPELAEHWHPSKNRGLTPDKALVCLDLEVYLWNDVLSHLWRQTPRSWMREHGFGSLLEPFEELTERARKEDEAANPILSATKRMGKARSTLKWQRFTSEMDLKISLRVWCETSGHEYLLDEWDEKRNADITPETISRCSLERVWWKGPCGHTWQASIRSRARAEKLTCPRCAGVK